MSRALYPCLLLLWLAAFAFESASVASWGAKLSRLTDRQEGLYASLDALARKTTSLVGDMRRASDDLGFLKTLPDMMPQDKGYRRTQKAVSEEVASLRRKLAPRLRGAVYVVIDAKANKLYLKKGLKLLWSADCSVGRGGTLVDKKSGQKWEFVTPRGEFRVLSKAEAPKWRRPDWSYVETAEIVPAPADPARLVEGELGAYLLNLGDGYLIHGTKNEQLLGRPASHGCVRLGAADLKDLYAKAPLGTRVFIFY